MTTCQDFSTKGSELGVDFGYVRAGEWGGANKERLIIEKAL